MRYIRIANSLVQKYNCGGFCASCRLNLDVSHHLEVDSDFFGK